MSRGLTFALEQRPNRALRRVQERLASAGTVRKHVCEDDSAQSGKNVLYWHAGEELSIAEWARRLGVDRQVLHKRMKMGWDFARVLTPTGRAPKRYERGR